MMGDRGGLFGMPVYYLIRPNEALLEQYGNSDWIDPKVWYYEQADSKLMRDVDYILQMKLIFLAYLHDLQEVLDSIQKHEQTVKTIGEVIGQPPYSVEIFDRWWTIERLRPGPDFHNELKMLSARTLGTLARTNNQRIDNWIEAMIEIKRSKENPDKTE